MNSSTNTNNTNNNNHEDLQKKKKEIGYVDICWYPYNHTQKGKTKAEEVPIIQ